MEQKNSTASQAHSRLWVAAMLLCAAALVAGVYLTYSAFMGNDHLKSVAATGGTENLFGSDMLIGYTSAPQDGAIDARSITVDPSSGECSFSFKIYNYLPGDKNRVNDKDVHVTLTVAAEGATQNWSINPSVSSQGASLSFPGYIATDYPYTVTFNETDLGKISFLIKANVEDNSPGTNLTMLAARIKPSERATVTAASVIGEWVDRGSNVADFAAYNYRVTVSGAAADVTLTWDNTKVELDPHFIANHEGASISTDGDTSSVTYAMQPGSEIVNFFNVGTASFGDWEAIGVEYSGATKSDATKSDATAEGSN